MAKFDWEIDLINITQAYLNTNLHHHIYLKLPEGAEVPAGKVYKLVKSLYGLKQSVREWHQELDAHLQCLGFFPLLNVPCIYLQGSGKTWAIIAVYVNDMLIISLCRTQITQIKKAIVRKWKITDKGLAMEFLKIKITPDQKRRTIDLDQHTYIKEIVEEWIMLQEKMWTPMTHTPPTPPPDFEADRDIKTRYLILVSKLLWVVATVQLDISFTANTLAQHMSKPTEDVMQAALQVIKYLNQTCSKVLQIGGEERNNLAFAAYTNSNWAMDPHTNWQSTSRSIIKVFGSLVTWNSHVLSRNVC